MLLWLPRTRSSSSTASLPGAVPARSSLPRSSSKLFSSRSLEQHFLQARYRFSNTYPEARFYKLDVDEVPDVAQELGIRAMPTFLLFKNGDKVAEVVGANPKALETAIKDNLGAASS